MSHRFFCEFADQTLKNLAVKIVGLVGIIFLGSYWL